MKQMIIHMQNDLLQMAILQNGVLVDYYAERPQASGMVGSFYKGRVVNVLPGMEAAFIDIGLSKNAFLYRDDLLHPHLEKQPSPKPSIGELVKPGQELIVQLMKEPMGTKGAKVTTHISLPGRYLVYMPHADYLAVSKKVDEQERARLKAAGERLRRGEEGIIMRTAAVGEQIGSLAADVERQRELWASIVTSSEDSRAPVMLYSGAELLQRVLRDKLTVDCDEIWIDDAACYKDAAAILGVIAPKQLSSLKLYKPSDSKVVILESFRVEEQLERALQRSIPLKNGGYLIWEHTEALTVIDVNTGKYVGTTDLEATVFHTNLEAADEIARLLRIRDAGGIIIVDFIDMELEEHRTQIMERLIENTRLDHTKCTIVGWTKLGLLEMTRKKSRKHLNFGTGY